MKHLINGKEVTLKEFNKACKKELFYEEYLDLIKNLHYDTSFEGEYGDGNVFDIVLENGKREFEIYGYGMYDDERVFDNTILANNKDEALELFKKSEYYEEGRTVWAKEYGVMPMHRFEGYSSEESMYSDLHPSRPIEL